MLLSMSSYLGLDSANGAGFRKLMGVLSLLLAVPVVVFSALEYWRSAWVSLKQRLLNIDVPIAAGILALFAESAFEVISGHGEGYFDTLSGLVFFLLCGKLFQQKTFDRLVFDRDYRSFFPLSTTRLRDRKEERVSLSQLTPGNHLVVRNGELIPADSRLLEGPAVIDYSFVTGESELVECAVGAHLYAGGRQVGGAIQVETVKAVSQGYLTSLWNQEALRKGLTEDSLQTVTNRYSQRFTKLVVGIALGSGIFWAFSDLRMSLKAFTSVLIVACPCALALAAPFALGTAQRLLARRRIFLKNPSVLEALAAADAIVFDKTGTLTAGAGSAVFHGTALSNKEEHWLHSLAKQSGHPYAARISEATANGQETLAVRKFLETPGCGMEGEADGHQIVLGSAAWLGSRGIFPVQNGPAAQGVHLAVDGQYRGCFEFTTALRPRTSELLARLGHNYQLSLLSGDNEKERWRFDRLFGESARLHFNQSPIDKLAYIQALQKSGRTVVMIGDGLNDAGALKQSDVGVAVVEQLSAFSPASDVILSADRVPQLGSLLQFAKESVRIVRISFLLSALYNAIGIAIAARGQLSPVVCAVLMPLSSVTVVAFACGTAAWLGRKHFPREVAS
jgi:Cu+-exporting ATPase